MSLTFGFVPRRLMGTGADFDIKRPWDDWMRDLTKLITTAEKAGFSFMGEGGRLSLMHYASYASIPCNLRFVNETLTLPMLDPMQLAIEGAHLDHILKGRLDFGVSIGYRPWELQAVGMTRKDRVGRLVESLKIIKLLWSEDSPSFHGKYWDFDELPLGEKPFQNPHPPIIFSLHSHPAAARAGRLGDGICIGPTAGHEDSAAVADTFRESYQETNGKLPAYIGARRDFFLGPDPNEAARQAGQKEEYLQFGPGHNYVQGAMSEPTSLELHIQPVGDELPGNAFGGQYSHMLEQLSEFVEKSGCTHITCSFYNCQDTFEERLEYIQGFGEEVISKIK